MTMSEVWFWDKRAKYCSIVMTLLVATLMGWLMYSINVHAEGAVAAATFISPEGIEFESYSTMWGEHKLKELYQKLLACGHGEELNDLKKVILLPEKSTGKSGSRVGHYDLNTRTIRIFEVESVPVERILVHEYGHHFTYYWLHQKEGIYPYQLTETSEWSKKRQLSGYPIRWSGSKLPYIHKWDPEEIMAEDYVLLFGVGAFPPPTDPRGAAFYLRQENDYIAMPEALPAIRRYWEEAAGLTRKERLRFPRLQAWDYITETPSENAQTDNENELTRISKKFRLRFSSAAVTDNQEIHYGIHLIGFQEQGALPVKMTFGVISTGKDAVETTIDLGPMYEELRAFYTQIQLWALDTNGKQLIYTPIQDNWFEYNDVVQALRPIPFPFQRQRLNELLQKDGMPRWPLVHVFVNGRPVTAIRRYDDQNGVIYIPIKSLDETESTSTSSSSTDPSVKIKFHQHEVQLQNNDNQATKDGKPVTLQQKIMTVDNEPMILMNDLNELLDVTIRWDEGDSTLFVDSL